MPLVTLVSSDDKKFPVDAKVAKMSGTVASLMEAYESNENEAASLNNDFKHPIPLANVDGATLEKVLVWCTQHKDDPAPTEENQDKPKCTISEWDNQFFMVNQKTLFDIIMAANYMDITGLLNVACKTVANMMEGKGPEEIRKLFNIKNDYTPQEYEQLMKKHAWCMKK